MSAACQQGKACDHRQVQESLIGNLCRCTGYLPIIAAAMAANGDEQKRTNQMDGAPDVEKASRESVNIEATDGEVNLKFFKPATIEQAVGFKADNPQVMVIAGGTDLGVRINKGIIEPTTVMSLSAVPGLTAIEESDGILQIGAATTWSAVENFVRDRVPEFHQIMELFGSPQIRNAGTVAGNIANASPIADSLPFFYVMDAELELIGTKGVRRVKIDRFYKGYKQLDLAPDELISRVHVPLPKAGEVLKLYKVSKRKHMDISSFTAAILMTGDDYEIESARIAYGGVGPVVFRVPKTEAFLAGQRMTEELMREAGELAASEISPISDVRGSSEYRAQLAENILLKFYFDVSTAKEELSIP
jgi:xanthine dehydrogenase small subunit